MVKLRVFSPELSKKPLSDVTVFDDGVNLCP